MSPRTQLGVPASAPEVCPRTAGALDTRFFGLVRDSRRD